MLAETPAAYVWETNRGLYILEADEDLLFFRALRAQRTARTVGDLWEVDGRLGLELNAGWDDMWSIVPTEEDFERFDQGSDDSKPLHHWRDHLAIAGFAFEFTAEDMPRPYDEWLPEPVVGARHDWMADEYRVRPPRAARARLLLEQHGIRLVDEPALADAFEGQS
jgi:hypothetical protein